MNIAIFEARFGIGDEGDHPIEEEFKSDETTETAVAIHGKRGSDHYALYMPESVLVSDDYNVYVLDEFNYHIQRWKASVETIAG
ncbi:unnamed protein product, partial [Didymodactylos carnosus]